MLAAHSARPASTHRSTHAANVLTEPLDRPANRTRAPHGDPCPPDTRPPAWHVDSSRQPTVRPRTNTARARSPGESRRRGVNDAVSDASFLGTAFRARTPVPPAVPGVRRTPSSGESPYVGAKDEEFQDEALVNYEVSDTSFPTPRSEAPRSQPPSRHATPTRTRTPSPTVSGTPAPSSVRGAECRRQRRAVSGRSARQLRGV
jgi:hypothetical protein